MAPTILVPSAARNKPTMKTLDMDRVWQKQNWTLILAYYDMRCYLLLTVTYALSAINE